MYYYKFNISDWHLATSHLSLEEEAIYFKLINFYYDSEQPIPLETQSVCRRLRLLNYSGLVETVLHEFFIKSGDGWHHNRCDSELEKYHHKAEVNQKVGKLGGRPKNNPDKTQSVSKDNPQVSLTTNHKPLTTNHKPIKSIQPEGFDLFWNAYDKKVGKPNAIKQWQKIKPDAQLLTTIVSKAKADKIAKPDNKYRKDPERWLKGQHWLDEVIVEQATKSKELPLGTEKQIEEAYRVECGKDPALARFGSYFEMRNYIVQQREKRASHG
jgi:uncharacterized protein YdaU (DUF1376 family)